MVNDYILKSDNSKRHIAVNPPSKSSLCFEHTPPIVLATFCSNLGVLFHESHYEVWSKYGECCQACKNIRLCPSPHNSPDLAQCNSCLIPEIKMTVRGKHFKLIQDVEVSRTVQPKTFTKEDSRATAERDKDDGISMPEAGRGFWGCCVTMCLLL